MNTHPEQRSTEVFLGNVPTKRGPRECFSHLRTIRIGEQAYDIHGKKIDQDYMRPLFVGKCDEIEYERIYIEQMKS